MVQYNPGSLLNAGPTHSSELQRALLILNQPLRDAQVLERVWRNVAFVVCADGGANQLYDMLMRSGGDHANNFLPKAIVGDFDSLRDDVRDFYSARGVELSHHSNQISTDFGKSMAYILSATDLESPSEIVVLGSLGGRVDHGLGMLHEMLREKRKRPDLQMWLFSEASISVIVGPGNHEILLPAWKADFTKYCGILPQYGKALISTQGLTWDVHDWDTEYGGNVSTCNHLLEEVVYLQTSHDVLFTVERKC